MSSVHTNIQNIGIGIVTPYAVSKIFQIEQALKNIAFVHVLHMERRASLRLCEAWAVFLGKTLEEVALLGGRKDFDARTIRRGVAVCQARVRLLRSETSYVIVFDNIKNHTSASLLACMSRVWGDSEEHPGWVFESVLGSDVGVFRNGFSAATWSAIEKRAAELNMLSV